MAKKKETKSNQNPFILTKVPDPSENGGDEAAMSAARQTISRPGLKLGEHKELLEVGLLDIIQRSSQTLGRIAHNKVTTAATSMARLELDKRRAEREAAKRKNRLIVTKEEEEIMEEYQELFESGDLTSHLAHGGSIGIVSAHKSGASKKENAEAHAKLGNRLKEMGYSSTHATEPGEKKSIFHKREKRSVHIVKNISRDHLKKLGNEFGQDHVVHGTAREQHVIHLDAAKKHLQGMTLKMKSLKEEQLDESCAHDAYCKYHKRAGSSLKNIAGHLDRHAYLTNKAADKAAKKGYNSMPDHHSMKNIADQLEALELQLAQDNEFKNDMQKPVKAIKEQNGAGEEGTPALAKKYAEGTPGQSVLKTLKKVVKEAAGEYSQLQQQQKSETKTLQKKHVQQDIATQKKALDDKAKKKLEKLD